MMFAVSLNGIDIRKVKLTETGNIMLECKHDFNIILTANALAYINNELKKQKDKLYEPKEVDP